MLFFDISHNQQQDFVLISLSDPSNGFNLSFPSRFSSRHQTGQVKTLDFSDKMKMDHCMTSFFPHLSCKKHTAALHLVQVITSSIKVTSKTIFTHDCLISGHYKRWLRFEWSDFFLSVILDEVLMCTLSHRVGQLRLLRVMRLMCAL